MRCQFCGEAAVHRCHWPVEKPSSISHWDLEETHVVVTQQTKKALRPLTVRRFMQRVSFLDDPRAGVRVPVTMYALRFPDDRYFLYYLWDRDRVNVLSPALCDNACCEMHVREVGDRTHYCMAHWGAWQSVDLVATELGATA